MNEYLPPVFWVVIILPVDKKIRKKSDKEIEVNAVYQKDGKTFQSLMEELLKIVNRTK